jgi:hypothetical protein
MPAAGRARSSCADRLGAFRTCRLSCKFCVVSEKEGKPYFLNSISDIWRGTPYPRNYIYLITTFGHDSWRNHIREIIDGNFRVCSQGINVRMIKLNAEPEPVAFK